jgi:hypothetical protein
MADNGAPAPAAPGVALAPPVVPQAAAGPAHDAGQLVNAIPIRIRVPNLRNGNAEDIAQAAPRSSIASQYKWAHIAQMTWEHMVANVDAVIRAQYAQVLTGFAGGPNDAERTSARIAAIILGSIRAGAAAALQIGPADMNAEEIVGAGAVLTPGAAGEVGRITGGNGTAGGRYTVMMGMAALDADEIMVVNALLYLGMAVPVMQGISLVLTGHHYLPTTKNHFAGMKRQALQVSGATVQAWVDVMGDTFDDLAFHKACHPISPPTKRRWAKTPELAVRMTASGHTAAAIRIPALPSDAQGAKAALAVVMKAAPVIRGMGHTVTWEEGSRLLSVVEGAAEGRAELDAVAAARNWMAVHASPISFCIGVVQYLAESGGNAKETTLTAFSVKKLLSDNSAEVARGTTYARAYMSKLREQAMSGEYPDPMLNL